MAGEYHLERRAFEDGYLFGDVDGKVPGGVDAGPGRGIMLSEGAEQREPGGREFGCALDVPWIVEGVEKFEVFCFCFFCSPPPGESKEGMKRG